MTPSLGPLVQSFFMDYLPVQKGLRQGSIRSYRDTIRLFLCFVSEQRGDSIASLTIEDLSFERVLAFLKYLEQRRGNSIRTRNQRRAALNTFYSYLALRVPEMLAACQRIAAIPIKRTSLPDTHYLEQEEVTALFRSLSKQGRFALRDRTLLLFLYNTGARVQEVADLRMEHLDFVPPAMVHLHGKGDKWRIASTNNSAPVSAHRGGPPARIRCRDQCHSWLAWTRQSRYYKPLCRADVTGQGRSIACLRGEFWSFGDIPRSHRLEE